MFPDSTVADGADGGTHLPQSPELPLFDAQQLSEFPRDDGGVPRGVVQDGLPKGRAGPQRANNDSILTRSRDGASCELFPHKSPLKL